MSGFKLTENGRFNMNLFKDKLKFGDLNSNSKLEKLFALFDISKDGELDSNEIKQLLGKFNTYASSNDKSIFETEEVQAYLNETVDTNGEKLAKNISVSDVLAFLKTLAVEKQATQPELPQSDEALTEQELQQVVVQTLDDDSTKARALFDKQNREQGPVSNASNWVKELFNTEYAQTQVDRALMVDDFSAFLIKKASSPEGITKKEYYEAKIEFIVQLVKKFDKSIDEANLDIARRNLKQLSPKRIESIVQSISTLTDNCTPQDIVNCIKDKISTEFKAQNSPSDSIDLQVREVAQRLPDKPSETTLADMEVSGTLNEKMEFEEVFYAERGVVYDKEAINDYTLKNAQFEILSQMHNTVALIDTVSNEVMSDQRNEVSLGKNQIDTLNNLISSIYGTNVERAKEDLAIDGVSLASHDGKIVVSQNGLPLQRIKALSLLTRLKQVHQERFEKALGDKTFEEYAQENSEAYKKAYGYSNVSTIVNNYIESQGKALGWMKAGATYTGMALMIAGDLIPIPAGKALKVLGTAGKMAMSTGGLLTATFGSAGISYLESSGKAGGMTEEDKQEILEEVKNGVLLTASGMWISKVSHSVAQTVAQTCPKLLALTSEIGVDGAMSLVADLAITGEINFSGEGVAQLTNVLVGIIRARGVKNFMKDYAPKGVNGVNDEVGKSGLSTGKNSDGVNDGIKTEDTRTKVSEKTTAITESSSTKVTEKDIRDLIENNPDLKNNEWVQANIEMLINKCKEQSDDAPLINLRNKLSHPFLTNHRLEVLKTFLSDPLLYNNKGLQTQDIIYRIGENKQECKTFTESLKLLSQHPEFCNNEKIEGILGNLMSKSCISPENKIKFLELVSKDTKTTIDSFFNKYDKIICYLSDKDDIEFIVNASIKMKNKGYIASDLCASAGTKADIDAKKELFNLMSSDEDCIPNWDCLYDINEKNIDFAKRHYKNDDLYFIFATLVDSINKINEDFAEVLIKDPDLTERDIVCITRETQHSKKVLDFIQKEVYNHPRIDKKNNFANICSYTTEYNIDFSRKLINDPDFPPEEIYKLLERTLEKNSLEFAKILYEDKSIKREDLSAIFDYSNITKLEAQKEIYKILKADKNFPDKYISNILKAIDDNGKNKDFAIKLAQDFKKMEIPPEKLTFLVKNYEKIDPRQFTKLKHTIGIANIAKLSDSDLFVACQVPDLFGKTNINEIPIAGKKDMLRSLVSCNEGLFKISDTMKKMFPLLPTNKEAYCELLPAIVRSLGIETNTLTKSQVESFNHSISDLSSNIAKLSDTDFANLNIRQEYPKDDFIKTVLEKVKDLSPLERQKVYDYFGFELHKNKDNPTGFMIKGYPVNLNNGKKLAQITDPNTKAVVESLRSDVIRFSENNRVKCNNPKVEQLLNDVVDALPELRAQIGKAQHKTHDFDVFTHSLKVMQKVSQDPKFETLNESDKKVMMLASLLHDITKVEGKVDKTHAGESSFDTFFIAKKFSLTREEEIKLYTLTRHHEWLEYVNTAKNEEQLTKRLQSTAYDLRHDNLLDMALMFTHADLKSVKSDDSFHDTVQGKARMGLDNRSLSFGKSAEIYAERMRGYIAELKKSQPILPVTKIPKSSKINNAITVVHPDGSTNLKGVYKNQDGLVIIKFSEVENWEELGFPPGTISRGIKTRTQNSNDINDLENVDTGNLKFFVHGLDYENQLAKFDAFSLIDSDVLLSVSYAERPESKFRFFRAQGVLLDVDTKYIHGGGETDAGSGCGKFVEDFKNNYLFGAEREKDRLYISDLIKKVTGMNDNEYIDFVTKNENKPLSEIEPANVREKIIKAFATINSNSRKGARAYNEMYISNPNEVMGVFAYSYDLGEKITNPVEFLNRNTITPGEKGVNRRGDSSVYERTQFLQEYALEHDLPFIIFSD